MDNNVETAGTAGEARGAWLLGALAAIFCALAYGFALNGPLFFDDLPNITENSRLYFDPGVFDQWRQAILSSHAGPLLRPVSMFTFALNSTVIGGLTPFSLKLTNLFIHLSLGVLVFLFCRAALRTPALSALSFSAAQCRWVAVLAAALWLLHPIHVSTVLYAVQRMAQLSALFCMVGLVYYLHVRLRWSLHGATSGEVLGGGLWLCLLTVLATLSKENGALLPLLLLALEATLFRGTWQGAQRDWLHRLAWCLLLLPVLVITLVLLLAPVIFADSFHGTFTLEERLLTQPRVLWTYLGWLVVPNILDMGFFHDDIALSTGWWSPWSALPAIAAWLAILAGAAFARQRHPLLLFALVFFLAGHSMESSVLPLQMAFEHRNYLPSVAVMLVIAAGLVLLAGRMQGLDHRALPAVVVVLFVVLLAVRTSSWRDELSLARFNVINHPESPRANFFYANALYKRLAKAPEFGLGAEQEQALAVSSRQYFERMHLGDPSGFAAMVMLYQLDTYFFPGLAQENDWLDKLEVQATSRPLTTIDLTAFDALLRSVLKRETPDRERVGAMLQTLFERDPWRADLLSMQFRYLMTQGPEGEARLQALLQQTLDTYPDSYQAAAYLAQFNSTDDLDATYEALRQWLHRDRLRRELAMISGIFRN